MLIISLSIKDIQRMIYLNDSYISLKIRGIEGTPQIYYNNGGCDYPARMPDEIHINGEKQGTIKSNYLITNIENNITLIFKNKMKSTSCMFKSCSQINEIDLSYFDSSEVTDMYSMFSGCSSLTSINASNFVTEEATHMNYMFEACSSLKSLDLSIFNTSKITYMKSMFKGCTLLEYIDLAK